MRVRALLVAALVGLCGLAGASPALAVTGLSASASSQFDGSYAASNAIDSNLSTSWAVGSGGTESGQWIEFSFAEACATSISLTDRGSGASGYSVATSSSQSVTETSLSASGARTTTLDGSAVTWVRVTYTGSVAGDGGWAEAVIADEDCDPPASGGVVELSEADRDRLDSLLYAVVVSAGLVIFGVWFSGGSTGLRA